jgi:hypothetical protein
MLFVAYLDKEWTIWHKIYLIMGYYDTVHRSYLRGKKGIGNLYK